MAVNFVARKCACGGSLEFSPEKKVWICKYCGTVVEREATFDKVHVDGIEGINDVVRQTLKDVANLKMESAARNLEDCERKGHQHVGTLLANISYNLSNISVAKTQDEARASVDKVKIYASRLQKEFSTIAEDEINLYESFSEDDGDIFANLLATFDTLGDESRVEYVSTKLRAGSVFSPSANKILLKIAIRRGDQKTVEAIVNNSGHIDRPASLQEVMDNYPSDDRKAEIVKKLFDKETATALSKRYFETYFAESKDSIDVKIAVVKLLNTTDIHVNAETVVKNSQGQFDQYIYAKKLFDAIYEVKISDQETESLLILCLMVNKHYEVQKAFFDTLIEKEVFVALNARAVISFLDSTTYDGKEKAEILEKMLGFNLDPKGLDAIYNYYLNNNSDDTQTRLLVIDKLLVSGAPITTGTVRNYVVQTTVDGDSKLEVIDKIISTGINKTYLGDILSEYMMKSSDSEELKKKVFDYLVNLGFKADSGALSQYITTSEDNVKVQIAKTKQLINNGTQIKSDAIDDYIMSLNNPGDFSEEMFNLLTSQSYSVSLAGYTKFLISCKDLDKARHNEKLVYAVNGNLSTATTTINHLGNNVSCNVLQAYVLTTIDMYEIASQIVKTLLDSGVKLNSEISVNGTSLKFKKYVSENKASLSPLTLQICEANRMFSLF